MLNNKEIRLKAKEKFKANYWLTVVIVLFLIGVSSVSNFSSWLSELKNFLQDSESSEIVFSYYSVFVSSFGFAVVIFGINPLQVGVKKYLLNTETGNAKFTDVFFAFSCGNYWKIVLATFLTSLYTCLWSLLFIVPGIIRFYMYSQVNYLLAENPELGKDAIAKSKEMMEGHKGQLFCLDLSFIGWEVLSIISFGAVAIFWTQGYHLFSYKVFYNELVLENKHD